MTFADSQLTFANIGEDAWGSFRLQIGAKDVTDFRGTPAQIAGYQLVEPYTYGPADFNLPQISMFEADQFGTGDLAWFDLGKSVVLKQVDSSGAKVRVVWRGFVSIIDITADGAQIHCEGEATGRLSLRDHHPALFSLKRHVGRKIYDAFNYCRLDLTPFLGGDIGVLTNTRGDASKYIDYVDSLLALTIDTDGSQYTIRAKDAGGYHLQLKDTDTTDFTVFLGAHGVDPDLSSSIDERITEVFGSGRAPSGLAWVNGKYPNLKQGSPPDYPMVGGTPFGAGTVDGDTATGSGVTVMINKLGGGGYLDREDKPGGYDSDVVEAIKELQDDAGLSQTGIMDPFTWDALFDLNVTGASLVQTFVAPLAASNKVRKWNLTANGSKSTKNPAFDPSVMPVDLSVDHGDNVEKQRARRWSRGVLHRAQNGKQWSGTITLTSDVFQGSHHADDAGLGSHAMSRLDIREGTNVMLRNFDGDTQFHVSGVNVTVDESSGVVVQLAVDTQARDAATLGEVIARNEEARTNNRRTWKREHRSDVNIRQVEFSEVGGKIFNTVFCPANSWTVVKIVSGQTGYISRIAVQTTNDEAAFVTALMAQKVTPGWLRQHIGNPFDTNAHGESKWTNASILKFVDNQRSLLGVWGDAAQPCGYGQRTHTNAAGDVTDAPIVGWFFEDAGISYRTFDEPILYLPIYPDRDTFLDPQRILWPLEQNSN